MISLKGMLKMSQRTGSMQLSDQRIRPVKYIPDWKQIPTKLISSKMQDFEIPYKTIRESNPWATDEEYAAWQKQWDKRSKSRIVRLKPRKYPWPEINKLFDIFGFGCLDLISFVELPKGTGYPPHIDTHRSCNINFIRPSTDNTALAPIVIEDNVYNWDRFVFDPKIRHSVPAVDTTRFTMMLTYLDTPYDEVLGYLRRDGWV